MTQYDAILNPVIMTQYDAIPNSVMMTQPSGTSLMMSHCYDAILDLVVMKQQQL